MRSNPAHQISFIFQPENILRSYLNFSTSYGRSTDSKSLLGLSSVSFKWLGEQISLKYLLIGRGSVCPPMSRRCRHRFCPNWLMPNFCFNPVVTYVRVISPFFSGLNPNKTWRIILKPTCEINAEAN